MKKVLKVFSFCLSVLIIVSCATVPLKTRGSTIHSNEKMKFKFEEKIEELLSEGKEVRVFLFLPIESITNSCNLNYEQKSSWRKGIQNELYDLYTKRLLKRFSNSEQFFLIDRKRIEQILAEHKLSLSGVIDEKSLSEIKELIGANYMIDISYSRFCSSNISYTDVETLRLIELNSGRLLSSDRREYTNRYNSITQKRQWTEEYHNGRKVVRDPRDNNRYYKKNNEE